MPLMLPVSDGQLEPHVPDHMVPETGAQGNPVLKGVYCHGENQTCGCRNSYWIAASKEASLIPSLRSRQARNNFCQPLKFSARK